MDIQFVIGLTEHRILGLIFAPYLIRKDRKLEKYSVYERVNLMNISTYESILTPEENQLVKTIEEYNDNTLYRIFSKKKMPVREFLSDLTRDFIEEHVRPYIERRMAKCLDILLSEDIPVYHKVLQNMIYENERIEVTDEEGTAVFNFHRSSEELKYYLTIESNGERIKLTGKNGFVVINIPCCVVIENRLFVFSNIDGKKLLPFFTKESISIPKSAEKKYFDVFVRTAIKKYKVNAKGFSVIDRDTNPKPVLALENTLSGRLTIALKFIYDEKSIYYANRRTERKVTCEWVKDDVYFYRLQRDYAFENNCIAKLLAQGLVNKEGPFFLPLQISSHKTNTAYEIINWINYNSTALKNAGFTIAQPDHSNLYYLDDFALKVNVSEKDKDWFDINAKVEFRGFVIPFTAFFDHIIQGEREYTLPDGRVMILPEEWFEMYRDILGFSKISGDLIQLDKQHFPLINKNLEGFSVKFRDSLRKLIDSKSDIEPVPEGVLANLREYQKEGYSWLYQLSKNNFGGCLADDMGLGKTLQTLTLLIRSVTENREFAKIDQNNREEDEPQLSLFAEHESCGKKRSKTSLIVVPASLVHNWVNETYRFVPDISMAVYVGSQRTALSKLFANNDVLLTSYGILRNDIETFIAHDFDYFVLDESQVIKNPSSKIYKAVMQIRADHKIVLTGTPIENSLRDLWAQINFLNPGLLGNYTFFRAEFQLPVEKYKDETAKEKLHQLITPFIKRRSKNEVAPELPPLTEQIIYCDLVEEQRSYYEREKSKARNYILENITRSGISKSSMIILQSLAKLRQVANHPFLVDEDYFAGSGKFDEVTRIIQNLHAEGNKALIFSSFVKHLNMVTRFLDEHSIEYVMLTGETRNREKVIKQFQENPDCRFFLISLKAGGVGLNITAAEYVFILDPWWNPAAEMQAISRTHRIGQDKHIVVYRFISKNTLEEKIVKLQQHKSQLADAFIHDSLKNISSEQIMELFD
ncbi:MAG: DEAD/DEAH box helicase [Bacteroidales bacterium]|nr:DEAD/DEAH box helicase [Bacteroidales bacterium]